MSIFSQNTRVIVSNFSFSLNVPPSLSWKFFEWSRRFRSRDVYSKSAWRGSLYGFLFISPVEQHKGRMNIKLNLLMTTLSALNYFQNELQWQKQTLDFNCFSLLFFLARKVFCKNKHSDWKSTVGNNLECQCQAQMWRRNTSDSCIKTLNVSIY